MLPYNERTPDTQYRDCLRTILNEGDWIQKTPQSVGALTVFGALPKMVFDLKNGVPLITERKMGFWRKSIAEIIAFMHGVRDLDELEKWGCDFWKDYKGRGTEFGLEPNDLGPGSYGAAFHDFPMPDGGKFNQVSHILDQLRRFPDIRTHKITTWIPFYIGRGGIQKAIVSPCHGDIMFRVINGRLDMLMHQRSADMPIGVPSNMIQYAAVLLMAARHVGLRPGKYIHDIDDAHIYGNQIERERDRLVGELPQYQNVELDPSVEDCFTLRVEHFTLHEYHSHPHLKIPYTP